MPAEFWMSEYWHGFVDGITTIVTLETLCVVLVAAFAVWTLGGDK